jgi:hypothetical protein
MVRRLISGRQKEQMEWIREGVVGGWKYIHWGIQGWLQDWREEVSVAKGCHSHTLSCQVWVKGLRDREEGNK